MMKFQNHDNNFTHLTIEQKEYATKVLNESDENRESAIAEIKRWIRENDLRARTDDFFILHFLRACKFNIEKTKTKLQNYQMLRATLLDWYENRDPLYPKLQELFNLGICLPMRKLDNEGRMVILIRLVYDPDIFLFAEVIKAACMVVDIATRDSVEASLYGYVIIVDFECVTLRHVVRISPRAVIKVAHAWQNCYPIRIKSLDIINMPEYARFLIEIGKYFLSKKLKERLHVYPRKSTRDSINVPANILPVEYGGTDGTIQELKDYWKKVVEDNRDWLIEDEKYKPI